MTDLPPEPDFALHPDADVARTDAERLYERVAPELRAMLPPSADIRHVGATAVAGCLSKGDLDIVVRVDARDFLHADAALAARFARNSGSMRTDGFSSFEDNAASPHLGIQLTVIGREGDDFHLFVDALNRWPDLIAEYNALKRAFVGRPMHIYREAKSAFVTAALARRDR